MFPMSRRSFLTNSSALMVSASALSPAVSLAAADQGDSVQKLGLQLLQLFRAPPPNFPDRLKELIGRMDGATESGAAWAVYQSGSMVVAGRPTLATATSRTGGRAARSVRNGMQLAALIGETAGNSADASALSRLEIPEQAALKVAQGEGVAGWSIALALAPGAKPSGRVASFARPKTGAWKPAS